MASNSKSAARAADTMRKAIAFGKAHPAPKTDLTCGFIAEAEKIGYEVKEEQTPKRSARVKAG